MEKIYYAEIQMRGKIMHEQALFVWASYMPVFTVTEHV